MVFISEQSKSSIFVVLFLLISCGGGGGAANDSPATSVIPSQPITPAPILLGSSLDVTILYDPIPQDARAKYLIDIGSNRPKSTMSNTFFKGNDVPQSTIDGIEGSLQSIGSYLGHYDVSYFAYGATYTGSENVALEYCNLWQDQYDVSEGRGCTRFTDSLTKGLGTGNANAASPGFSANEGYWANNTVWKSPPNTIEHYVEFYERDVTGYSRVVMHEYVHIHQLRPQINATKSNDGNEIRAMPGWFTEGGAELFAIMANNEINSLDNLTAEYTRNLSELNKNKYNLPSITERLRSFGRSRSYDFADYALGVYAVGHMVSLSNVQKVYMNLINDVYTKGWEQAFSDNMGMTLDSFYENFEAHMSQSDSIVLGAAPRPLDLKGDITPTYPMPRLQIKGAIPTANSGGQPTTLNRTVYHFDDDTSLIPTYQGNLWPYVTADTGATINNESSINADIKVTASGFVTVTNLPIYQYTSDLNPNLALGDYIGGKWYSITPQGISAKDIGFIPRKVQ